jgi:hypothetical protein
MKALFISCTLKPSPETSSTEALAKIIVRPLRLGQPSSVSQRVLEPMDAIVPGQSWTYWNRGPGPGEDYLDTEDGHEWSHSTGRAAAANLFAAATALEANPIPAPPSG